MEFIILRKATERWKPFGTPDYHVSLTRGEAPGVQGRGASSKLAALCRHKVVIFTQGFFFFGFAINTYLTG